MTPAEALEELWGMLSLNSDCQIHRAWAAREVLERALKLVVDEVDPGAS